MATDGVTRRSSSRPRPSGPTSDIQELPDYCARPSCRQPFTRVVGPGRPQAFCSDFCRRAAEKEERQLKKRLAHFEGLVDQLRVDLAAFNRGRPADVETVTGADGAQKAAEAVARVAGVLAFVSDSSEPLAAELRSLHDAVAPVIADLRGSSSRPA